MPSSLAQILITWQLLILEPPLHAHQIWPTLISIFFRDFSALLPFSLPLPRRNASISLFYFQRSLLGAECNDGWSFLRSSFLKSSFGWSFLSYTFQKRKQVHWSFWLSFLPSTERIKEGFVGKFVQSFEGW